MSKRIGTLAFLIALGVFATAWLPGAAQAGPASICGDGTTEGNELCDDGNTVATDDCSSPSCLPTVCGDDVLNTDPGIDEECDDANTAAGDGCAADCTCEPAVCLDGIVACTEACDDGNTVAGDGCENDCTVTPPPSEPQDKKQQKCINAINKNLAGVIKAQNADTKTCVQDVSKGKTTALLCYGTDVKGKVAKAQTKTTTTEGKKCNDADEMPDFGHTDPPTVNGAGKDETLEASTAVLGAAPTVIVAATDKDGAKCQAEIVKQLGGLSNTVAKEGNKAKKKVLKGQGGTGAVTNATELAAGIEAAIATTNPKIAKAENKVNTGIAKKCDDAQASAATECNGADTANEVTLCVIAAAKEGVCNAFEVSDAIALNCPTVPTP
jgi:cysteine-rich repeat protein